MCCGLMRRLMAAICRLSSAAASISSGGKLRRNSRNPGKPGAAFPL